MTDRNPTDDELIGRVRAKDEEAFTLLYRRWQGPLFRFALRMSGEPGLAEDVVQEVFMALIRGADHFDAARGSLPPYLYGIARNLVRRRLDRNRRLAAPAGDGEGSLPEPAADQDVLGDLARRQTIDRVRAAVLSLPSHYREPIVLCDLEGLSYEEAASILGCALGTVRSRLHRGRDMVQAKLEGTFANPANAPRRAAEGIS